MNRLSLVFPNGRPFVHLTKPSQPRIVNCFSPLHIQRSQIKNYSTATNYFAINSSRLIQKSFVLNHNTTRRDLFVKLPLLQRYVHTTSPKLEAAKGKERKRRTKKRDNDTQTER